MLKLLQIVVEGNTGSTGTIAESIGKLVMQKGWQSFIAHGRFPRSSASNIIRIGSDFDVIMHGISTRLFDRHGLGSKSATQMLIRRIRDIKPNIIHLHHLHGYYINIRVLFDFLHIARIPVVWTFHDCWSFTGHCAHFDYIGCQKWKTECNNCPQKTGYPASLLVDRSRLNFIEKKQLFTSVQSMVLVPVSIWMENLVKESFFKDSIIKTIHNGIDIEVFKPLDNTNIIKAKYGINGKFLILGVASPWGKRKGLADFIELSKYLKTDEVILLVGLNEKEIKNLPDNIIGLKKTENKQQLVELYSSADLFVNPTWEDNFPTTNIEALACGTPLVTYNTGGSIEAVTPETGYVVEKGSILGFVDVIKKVKEKGKLNYSKECRRRAEFNFSKDIQFSKYLELYDSLLNNSN